MNTKLALSALALAAFAGSALADDPTVDPHQFVGTKTRAEVNAELAAFQSSGVDPWSMTYQPLQEFHSTTSRADVVADYLRSRDQVHEFTGEDSGSAYLAQARVPSVPVRTLAGTPVNPQ